MLSPCPRNGTRLDYAATASDATVIRVIWQGTMAKIERAGPHAASDMKGADDYILALACRISRQVYVGPVYHAKLLTVRLSIRIRNLPTYLLQKQYSAL